MNPLSEQCECKHKGGRAEPTRTVFSGFSLRSHRASAEEREGRCIFFLNSFVNFTGFILEIGLGSLKHYNIYCRVNSLMYYFCLLCFSVFVRFHEMLVFHD